MEAKAVKGKWVEFCYCSMFGSFNTFLWPAYLVAFGKWHEKNDVFFTFSFRNPFRKPFHKSFQKSFRTVIPQCHSATHSASHATCHSAMSFHKSFHNPSRKPCYMPFHKPCHVPFYKPFYKPCHMPFYKPCYIPISQAMPFRNVIPPFAFAAGGEWALPTNSIFFTNIQLLYVDQCLTGQTNSSLPSP